MPEDLDEKLERIEAELRRVRRWLVASVLVGVLLVVVWLLVMRGVL